MTVDLQERIGDLSVAVEKAAVAERVRLLSDSVAKAITHYPAGAPGGKGGQFAPANAGGGGAGSKPAAGGGGALDTKVSGQPRYVKNAKVSALNAEGDRGNLAEDYHVGFNAAGQAVSMQTMGVTYTATGKTRSAGEGSAAPAGTTMHELKHSEGGSPGMKNTSVWVSADGKYADKNTHSETLSVNVRRPGKKYGILDQVTIERAENGQPKALKLGDKTYTANGKSATAMGNADAPRGTKMFELRNPANERAWISRNGKYVEVD
jgi:hypothetical protein